MLQFEAKIFKQFIKNITSKAPIRYHTSMKKNIPHDTLIIGAGAAGMMAAITAGRCGKQVLLLEKLPKIGAKLKATGGGRCNLSNTLSNEAFIEAFGKDGRFMRTVIEAFDHHALRDFFAEIGVETDVPDGFRIFPVGHSSQTIIDALSAEMARVGVEIQCGQRVTHIEKTDKQFHVTVGCITRTNQPTIHTSKTLIIATGGRGYPQLGAEGQGYDLAATLGHSSTSIFPAMMPLKVAQSWVESCRADTIPNTQIIVAIKKYRKRRATGDLIFTRDGIRGPVVLDFSREITPLLAKETEVPILINMTKGMDEEQIRNHIKTKLADNTPYTTQTLLETLLPSSLSQVLCQLSGANPQRGFAKQKGETRERLIQLLAWTPLTVTGHDGFDKAMITRGGIKLGEIDSNTMESKRVEGLYFCGEVVNLDGPCGGYNLQWAFSSGFMAGSCCTDRPYTQKLQ
jgi:predicted Rossmann fold flavoprotein